MIFLKFWVLFNCLEQLKCINSWKVSWELSGVMESLYTEMIKRAGAPERGILGLTIFFSRNSSIQRRTRNILLAKRNRRHSIVANHAIHATTNRLVA